MIPSAVDEQRLCPTQRALWNTFSNRDYERIGFVTTLYRVHKLLSVWLRSVRVSVPEETHQQRPGVEGPKTPPLAITEPSCEGQRWPRVSALSVTEKQAACDSAEWDPGELNQLRATQCGRAEGMLNRASGNKSLRAGTCTKHGTSGYTAWIRVQRKGLYAGFRARCH
jgi:hypothetical protein